MAHERRKFLKAVGAGALTAAFPASIERALAIPAHHRTGSLADVEHIVILMQENRSFDHYFGTLRGVRGFGDHTAARLPSGRSVFHQPNGVGEVLPFRPAAPDLGMSYLVDLPHGWTDTHAAWNDGKYDGWIASKGTTTMSYLERRDIPFHYALADAFTVCDAYFCSFMGATDPNRYHLWTGFTGNDGKGGGPVVDNSEAGYSWTTYPERLEHAGISWKIYQDAGEGLDAEHYWGWGGNPFIGNYGDNSLLYFHQYQDAAPGSPLHVGARSATNIAAGGTLFDLFRGDVATGRLPQVSWIIAPEAYSEHGNWPANFGAWYVSQMLDALTANPEVWSKTAFFLMFDENDGFFDHLVPPTPPASRAQGLSTVPTTNEIFAGNERYASGPYGLGMRVPMIVVSPWSKGGYVSSEVFDHTSLIRFIEQRFSGRRRGLIETNITPWRRAVVGDLTSAFNFKSPNAAVPPLPSTASFAPPDQDFHPDYVPPVPATQSVPKQEAGIRPARPVPYELNVVGEADLKRQEVELSFVNTGRAAAVLQVRSGDGQSGPWSYTVGGGRSITESWAFKASREATYDLSVHGPNGFLRSYRGSLRGHDKGNLKVEASYDHEPGITLAIRNLSGLSRKVRIFDAYTRQTVADLVPPGRSLLWHWSLEDSFAWYDLRVTVDGDATFGQRLAGHVETGRESFSDPLLGV